MKFKFLFLISFLWIVFACNEKRIDEIKVDQKINLKHKTSYQNLYVLKFKRTINKVNKQYYTAKYGDKLSEERKRILYPTALDLIYSTGINEAELMKETNKDSSKVINKALTIYNDLLPKR